MSKYIFLFFLFFTALNAQARVVSSILIKGNKRLSSALVKSVLNTKLSHRCSRINTELDLQNLENLEQFSFIRIDKKILSKKYCKIIYRVKERSILETLSLKGAETPKDEQVQKALVLKAGAVFSQVKLQDSLANLKALYEAEGLFASKITYKLRQLKNKNYQLRIKVVEKKSAKIKNIQIFGNKHLSTGKIKKFMQTSEKGFLSFISDSGVYRKEVLSRDIQLIRYLYLQAGYYGVEVKAPKVYLDSLTNNINIVIHIVEGKKYFIRKIEAESDSFSQEELKEQMPLKEGDAFSYAQFQSSIKVLERLYGDKSYAFVQVLPDIRINEEKGLLDIYFKFNLGPSVSIGKVIVSGNSRTHDHVIRRELLLSGGENYSNSKKEESINKVRYLGFFESVDFITKSSLDRPDEVDLNLIVKPKRVGAINLSAGYSEYLGFSFKAGVNQPNFLGLGHTLVSSVDISKKSFLLSISYIYPRLLNTDWSLSGSLFNSQSDREEYKDKKTGFSIRGSKPLNKQWSTSYSYSLKNTKIQLEASGDPDLFPVNTVNGIASTIGTSITYDSRDNRINPTKGKYFNLGYDYTGAGGDLQFSVLSSQFRFYKTLSKSFGLVWKNNLDYAQLFAPGGSYPFNELFLLGGPLSLRGYNWFSVGPYKFSQKAYDRSKETDETRRRFLSEKAFGGTKKVLLQTELEFPLLSEAQIRGAVFFDAGLSGNSFNTNNIESDVGLGIRWFSPLGPLRFEFGWPINPSVHHSPTYKFQFYIGNSF
ncbi:MAG: outer membrane protein assembly factor BamA [Bdellovibrionaceae bacterium]|nr:outer membrane protein assembly factor BamA [Pseudobdellovibrionaceae bacterium]